MSENRLIALVSKIQILVAKHRPHTRIESFIHKTTKWGLAWWAWNKPATFDNSNSGTQDLPRRRATEHQSGLWDLLLWDVYCQCFRQKLKQEDAQFKASLVTLVRFSVAVLEHRPRAMQGGKAVFVFFFPNLLTYLWSGIEGDAIHSF